MNTALAAHDRLVAEDTRLPRSSHPGPRTHDVPDPSCAIVIPFHQAVPSEHETRSLFNTLSTLSSWDTFILLPHGVDTLPIGRLVAGHTHVRIVSLEPGWLGSIDNYNTMATSPHFYAMFAKYTFILIVHMDAWIFRDQLRDWLGRGYDYIGAPLFLPDPPHGTSSIWSFAAPSGGNGGLCLRRVSKMLELTENLRIRRNYWLFARGVFFLLRNRRHDLLRIFLRICWQMSRDHKAFQRTHRPNEDVLISVLWALMDRTLRVAPPRVASKFALEVNAREIVTTQLRFTLPVGVHGLFKYIPQEDCAMLSTLQDSTPANSPTPVTVSPASTNDLPLVTVLTPIRNIIAQDRVATLRQSLESVNSQVYPRIEHLIIDGASTDGTLELLQPYVDRGQVRVVSERDQGPWDAMRKGVRLASGEFINIMNSDDYFCDKHAIRIAVDCMARNKADWFFSHADIVRADGSTYAFPTSEYGVFRCMGIVHQTMLVRKHILEAVDPFGVIHRTKENYLMMLLMLNRYPYASSPDALVHYREGGFSTHDYGGANLTSTREDFAGYFHTLAGKRWGLSHEDCLGMFVLDAFESKSLRHNMRVGLKLRLPGLRRWYFRHLMSHTWRHRIKKRFAREASHRVDRRLSAHDEA